MKQNIAKHFLLLIFIFAISLVNITSTFALGKKDILFGAKNNLITKGKVDTEVCKKDTTKAGIVQYSAICKTQCTSTDIKYAQFKDNKEVCNFFGTPVESFGVAGGTSGTGVQADTAIGADNSEIPLPSHEADINAADAERAFNEVNNAVRAVQGAGNSAAALAAAYLSATAADRTEAAADRVPNNTAASEYAINARILATHAFAQVAERAHDEAADAFAGAGRVCCNFNSAAALAAADLADTAATRAYTAAKAATDSVRIFKNRAHLIATDSVRVFNRRAYLVVSKAYDFAARAHILVTRAFAQVVDRAHDEAEFASNSTDALASADRAAIAADRVAIFTDKAAIINYSIFDRSVPLFYTDYIRITAIESFAQVARRARIEAKLARNSADAHNAAAFAETAADRAAILADKVEGAAAAIRVRAEKFSDVKNLVTAFTAVHIAREAQVAARGFATDARDVADAHVRAEYACKKDTTKTGIAQYSTVCKNRCISKSKKFAQFQKENKDVCDLFSASGTRTAD